MSDFMNQKPDLMTLLAQKRYKGLHNHKKVRDIINEMDIGPIHRLFLWLSKTDYFVLSLSTYQTRRTLESLGMMVLFTSMLAFLSSFYAIKSSLVTGDEGYYWVLSFIIAIIYSYGILIIDREIVGAVSSFKSTCIRILFAVFIAVAVSYPVKLAFYNGRIDNEITDMINERNADKNKRIAMLEQQARDQDAERREAVRHRIDILDEQIDVYSEEIDEERNRGGANDYCGPKCQKLQDRQKVLIDEKNQAEKELGPFIVPVEIQKIIDDLQSQIDNEIKISKDFLSKRDALNRIAEKSGPDYQYLSWFIMLFFIMLETVPLMLKLSIGKTEYHYYLESRQHLNTEKMISLTNLFLEAIQKNPEILLDKIFQKNWGIFFKTLWRMKCCQIKILISNILIIFGLTTIKKIWV